MRVFDSFLMFSSLTTKFDVRKEMKLRFVLETRTSGILLDGSLGRTIDTSMYQQCFIGSEGV
jgi:hypothetical protein